MTNRLIKIPKVKPIIFQVVCIGLADPMWLIHLPALETQTNSGRPQTLVQTAPQNTNSTEGNKRNAPHNRQRRQITGAVSKKKACREQQLQGNQIQRAYYSRHLNPATYVAMRIQYPARTHRQEQPGSSQPIQSSRRTLRRIRRRTAPPPRSISMYSQQS